MVNRYDLITITATGSNTTADAHSNQPVSGYIEKIVLNTQSIANGSAWVLVSGTNEVILNVNTLSSGNITATHYPRTITHDTAGAVTVGSVWTRPSVLGPLVIGGSALGTAGSVTAHIYWARP
jgi:hypothetical protein